MHRFDLAVLILAAVAWLTAVGATRGWRGAVQLQGAWHRAEAYARRAPATFAYAGIILVTTWVVAGLGPRERDALLRTQSTNLHNLATHPLDVLFRSAFWSGTTFFLPVLVLLALVLGPAEEWLGSLRLIVVFALGHVGATLLAALAISQGLFVSPGEHDLAHTIDVGVSYGLIAVAGVLTYRLPRRARIPYAAALLLVLGLVCAVGRTFTDFGHLVSALIGLASYPLVRPTRLRRLAARTRGTP